MDVALAGEGPLGFQRLESIKESFSESDLPIIVDVIDWNAISPSFRNAIAEECVELSAEEKEASPDIS